MDEVEQVYDSNQLPLLMALDHNRLLGGLTRHLMRLPVIYSFQSCASARNIRVRYDLSGASLDIGPAEANSTDDIS